jgi:hypothetical protein
MVYNQKAFVARTKFSSIYQLLARNAEKGIVLDFRSVLGLQAYHNFNREPSTTGSPVAEILPVADTPANSIDNAGYASHATLPLLIYTSSQWVVPFLYHRQGI